MTDIKEHDLTSMAHEAFAGGGRPDILIIGDRVLRRPIPVKVNLREAMRAELARKKRS